RSGADLLRAQDQCRELPGHRNLAGDHCALCRCLLPHCHAAALPGAASGDSSLGGLMYESPSWLHELWVARDTLWSGFLTSVECSVLAILLGTLVGIVAGLVLTYGKFWMRAPFRFYVDLIRGTPVFVLVLACFYMAPALGWQIGAFQAGVLGLTLFCGSHVAEIVRGSLQALPRGQMEASKAIGLTFYQSLGYVLLPQALRQILPTWV